MSTAGDSSIDALLQDAKAQALNALLDILDDPNQPTREHRLAAATILRFSASVERRSPRDQPPPPADTAVPEASVPPAEPSATSSDAADAADTQHDDERPSRASARRPKPQLPRHLRPPTPEERREEWRRYCDPAYARKCLAEDARSSTDAPPPPPPPPPLAAPPLTLSG